MLFSKLAGVCFLSFTFVVACPILERAPENTNGLEARAPFRYSVPHRAAVHKPAARSSSAHTLSSHKPGTSPNHKLVLYTGGGFEENARKANAARTMCKKLSDCKCPPKKPGAKMASTSCINGFCKCDDPGVNFFAGQAIEAVKAIGNSGIVKAIGNLMAGISDVKEVLGTIVGSFLGPEAKIALKAALMAFPDTGPSHIDQVTKGILTKGF